MLRSSVEGLARTVGLGIATMVAGLTLGAKQARAATFDGCAPGDAGTACWWAASCSQKCVTYVCISQTCGSTGSKVCVVCEDFT